MLTPNDLIYLQEGGSGGGFVNIIILLGILVVMYFFMIRPQMQRQKKERQFRQNLQKSEKVITMGGLHGKIDDLDETTVLLQVDEGIKVRLERSAIRSYTDQSGQVQTGQSR